MSLTRGTCAPAAKPSPSTGGAGRCRRAPTPRRNHFFMGDPLPSGNLLVGGLEHVLFLQMGNEIGTHGEKKYIFSIPSGND